MGMGGYSRYGGIGGYGGYGGYGRHSEDDVWVGGWVASALGGTYSDIREGVRWGW